MKKNKNHKNSKIARVCLGVFRHTIYVGKNKYI